VVLATEICLTRGSFRLELFEANYWSYQEAKMSDVFADVKEIIVEQLGVDDDKVTAESRFREDLEADSLDIVELIMAFEDKFGGEISDEDAQNIETVGDVVKFLEAR
jgi:acyl carrier protein